MLWIDIIDYIFTVMYYLIIARIILSFIQHNPYNPIIRFIYEVTEPVLKPFRKLTIPVGPVFLDLSPLLALIVLQLLQKFVFWLVFKIIF